MGAPQGEGVRGVRDWLHRGGGSSGGGGGAAAAAAAAAAYK